MDVLWSLLVILAAALAGAVLNNAIAMVPALRRLDEPTRSEIRRSWSPVSTRSLASSAFGAGLLGLLVLVFAHRLRSGTEALLAVGIGLSLATGGAILRAIGIERSARAGAQVSPTGSGADRPWDHAQLVAAACSVGALVTYAIAAGPGS